MTWFKPAFHDELMTRWRTLGRTLGLSGERWDHEGQRLVRSWARWPRRYHNTSHLEACLHHAGTVRASLENPIAVELALWFHDAIYWPWRPRNEEKSADWAVHFMREMAMDDSLSGVVSQHILATRHHAVPTAGDAQWVVDIDLAILGQNEVVYRQFEQDVRSEYRWVRWPVYVKGRTAVLQSFLQRPRVYATAYFFDRLEGAARGNMEAAVGALRRGEIYGPGGLGLLKPCAFAR